MFSIRSPYTASRHLPSFDNGASPSRFGKKREEEAVCCLSRVRARGPAAEQSFFNGDPFSEEPPSPPTMLHISGKGVRGILRVGCRAPNSYSNGSVVATLSATRQEMWKSNKISGSRRMDEEERDRRRPRVQRTRQMKVSDSIQWVEMKAGAATTKIGRSYSSSRCKSHCQVSSCRRATRKSRFWLTHCYLDFQTDLFLNFSANKHERHTSMNSQ